MWEGAIALGAIETPRFGTSVYSPVLRSRIAHGEMLPLRIDVDGSPRSVVDLADHTTALARRLILCVVERTNPGGAPN